MHKKSLLAVVIAAALLLLAGGSIAAVSVLFPSLIWLSVALWVIVAVMIVVVLFRLQWKMTTRMRLLASALTPDEKGALAAFPMPALLASRHGEILQYNELFNTQILDGADGAIGLSITSLFDNVTSEEMAGHKTLDVQYRNHKLTAYVSTVGKGTTPRYVLYFADNTELKDIAEEYALTRPVIMLICIDNLEETTQRLRDGDRARISGQIEVMLDEWLSAKGGMLQKYGADRFVAVTESRHLTDMTKNRFQVLDTIRSAFPEAEGEITLSIGVGQGKTVDECRKMARQAMEMALSRGGDQAAIKTANGYDFYGGQSRGVERRTKVRTRMVANALLDLILDSDRVLVLGHRLSDLDCLGSAAALAQTSRKLGIPANVVVRRQSSMAVQLIKRYENAGHTDLFVEPEEVIEQITKDTLLIITDVHSVPMLDAPDFYDLAKRVVVIDHHRRMVNYIKDADLTYHEPSSSSACELVTELLPYMINEKPGRLEAEALLSGIMLDTRNFVMRTGVRTFEAAAYLRSLGADTVSVKKMFAESLDLYRLKNDLVAKAVLYKETAITATDQNLASQRAAAAQAADDLLSVQGVKASFVLCPIGHEINISARSFGEMNVQLIMEALGGGGHQTMAATQIEGVNLERAKSMLKEAIDKYIEEHTANNCDH